MIQKIKLLRITTSSISMDILLRGQLAFLNQYFEVVCVSSGLERLRVIKEREGVRTYNLKMVRSINLVLDLISLIKLLFLFIREKPDLVHSNTPKASFLSMMAAWCLRIPIRIYTVTGLRFETERGLKRILLKNIERLTCYFSTTVIPEGKGVKNTLYNEKITKKTLKVINNGNINGIDLNYFNPEVFLKKSNQLERFKKILKIEKKEFVFCFVGRLVKDKGIRELIYAFLELYKMNFQNPNINHKPVLIIVGPMGYGKDRLDKETEQIIYSSPSIKYVGRQDDIRPYLMISDVFVFPSYREGFPNVVMQAGAMGLPCIVTDISGCNEIIVDRLNGLIIPPKDTEALFKAMQLLMDNYELRSFLSANARKMIADRFDQQDFWAALLEEYNTLIIEKLGNR